MTSPTVTYRNGYLEENYLSDEYLDGEVNYAYGMQAQMVIERQTPYGMQGQMIINSQAVTGMQGEFFIDNQNRTGMQAFMMTRLAYHLGMQSELQIATLYRTGMQAEMVIHNDFRLSMQALMITHASPGIGMQALMEIVDQLVTTGMEARFDSLRHATDGDYLTGPYLAGPYLTEKASAFLGMQAEMIIKNHQQPLGMQAEMVIGDMESIGMQALMVIHAAQSFGMQAQMVRVIGTGMQATMVIYNNTQLRFMYDFVSRGTPAQLGNNWTTTSQASGDFLPRNLNTDVEEQVFRSLSTNVELICDVGIPQGHTIDTVAIRNHNLTRSALVQVQGSNDPGFSTVNVSFDMQVELGNMYYVAPVFPSATGSQNRYWKFIINDATNTDGYVEIGTLLFGTADIIFSVHENFENPLRRGSVHFKDVLQTEGFTAATNDRALKKWLSMQFADIERIKGNFRDTEAMTEFIRTSLKCLVIPMPLYPSRFAIFGKLRSMPEYEHTNVAASDDPNGRAEYINFKLEFDESL